MTHFEGNGFGIFKQKNEEKPLKFYSIFEILGNFENMTNNWTLWKMKKS